MNKKEPVDEGAANEFANLVEIVRRLRAPDGCPWDREQTLETLRPFVLEEAYEVLEAIDRGDLDGLRGEVGDLIFEGVLLAQLAAERESFTVADSLRSVNEKLVRRHPHVFGRKHHPADSPTTPEEVLERWEALKAQERKASGDSRGALAGLPRTLPSLLRAWEIGTRVAAVGFDWEHAADVLPKVEEELSELQQAIAGDQGRERLEEELGDLLFSVANLARKLGLEPEAALRTANEKFARRFAELENRFRARGRALADESLESMEEEWKRIKDEERTRPRSSAADL
jgi:MazG family protein